MSKEAIIDKRGAEDRLYERGRSFLTKEEIRFVLTHMKKVGVGKYISVSTLIQDDTEFMRHLPLVAELTTMNAIGLLDWRIDGETPQSQYALTSLGLQVAENPAHYYGEVGRKLAEYYAEEHVRVHMKNAS